MDDKDKRMKENLKEKKEGELVEIEVVEIDCMDENVQVGENVVKIGVAGSAVTVMEGGNEKVYPLKDRQNIKDAAPHIYAWANAFARKNNVGTTASHHPECAAVGSQGVPEPEVSEVSENLANKYDTKSSGKLAMSKNPVKAPNAEHMSWFDREPGQPHPAWAVGVTFGGGATGKEISKMKAGKGEIFIISADWVKYALDHGFDKDKAVEVLVFQFKLAYSIAEGVRNNPDPFISFDAGRLDNSETSENREVVEKAIKIARQEISDKHWGASGHH